MFFRFLLYQAKQEISRVFSEKFVIIFLWSLMNFQVDR